MTRTNLLRLSAVASIVFAGTASAHHSPARTIRASSDVLETIQSIPEKSIPPALLADAQGIAIIPNVIKGGFVVGGRVGHGLVLSRNADGSWGGPAFVAIGGASIGLQAGVQSTDVILVFKSRTSLERVLRGKGKLTLGADVAVAAGPVGRQAEAGTDGMLKAEIYSYSRSRGLFAGVSLEGAAILYDGEANQEYAQNPRPEVIAAAERLKGQVATGGRMPAPAPPAILLPPAPPPVQPILPPPPPGPR
ncbi:MAG TPA: lipid-binding SYLF domain-containing protein [Gemmataceae bacterium]|nr:lipid-binding SYLF domain-containing protein [Gemmataceae bacterium]